VWTGNLLLLQFMLYWGCMKLNVYTETPACKIQNTKIATNCWIFFAKKRNKLISIPRYRFRTGNSSVNQLRVSLVLLYHKFVPQRLTFNILTPELNPSTQRCLTRILLGILLLEPCISLIYAWKTSRCNNYSFNLLIMYGSSYMFRHYIAVLRVRS
jgi:hypothetical protein